MVDTQNRKLLGVYLVVLLALMVVPFANTSFSMLVLLTQVFIFAAFAMSYDLLLGYTGIVSFGHGMFFGIGAYSTAILLSRNEPTIGYVLLSLVIGIGLAAVVSYVVGMLSLRLKSHFYAMLTLALSQLFFITAEKWRSLTMGNDGITFLVPMVLLDRKTQYFLGLLLMIVVFFLLRTFTLSPVGRVLQAIRENEGRVQSLGYNVLHYKIIASILAGVVASVSGALFILTIRFVSTSVFAVEHTLDVLLMTIIGGVGTLIGPIVGAALIEFAHHWLSGLADVSWIFKRWIILFGFVYILAVMFFPKGIVGSFVEWRVKRRGKKIDAASPDEFSVQKPTEGA